MIQQNSTQKYSFIFHRFAFTQRGEHHLARATRAGASPAPTLYGRCRSLRSRIVVCQTPLNHFGCHSERSEESHAGQRFFAALRMTAGGSMKFGRGVGAGASPALVAYAILCIFVLLLTSCNWPGTQQTAQSDPRLKSFHVLSARIIMLDTQAEVDGTLQNTSHSDHFPYDVTVIATFYNSAGTVVGQAGGVAEDVYPGMIRPFTLIGQVDNTQYSHMIVTVISLKERRIEKNRPTPTVAP